MEIFNTIFERFGAMYIRLFSDWLHINFLIRTVLLLLMVWLVIYVAAQIFQYIIAPGVLLLCRYVARAANPSGYADMVHRAKPLTLRLLIICAVASTLWVTAFGLHHEYAVPAMGLIEVAEAPTEVLYAHYETPTNDIEMAVLLEPEPFDYFEVIGLLACEGHPAVWPSDADIVFYLNEEGAEETRLRSGPGIENYRVIEILWDNDLLVYLHHFYPDADDDGLFWLRVLTPGGTIGYVSSHLVEKLPLAP
ncbi:MAG: SH3 domain-containing protein [Defluviitaleaceae bacterium]|nr:SH3 domain-containing protein [Defluviitaleaceae bacterium]